MNLPDTRTRLFPAFFLGTFLALTAAAQQPPPAQASAKPKVGDYVASRIPGLRFVLPCADWYCCKSVAVNGVRRVYKRIQVLDGIVYFGIGGFARIHERDRWIGGGRLPRATLETARL